jgi:hypothetical protein
VCPSQFRRQLKGPEDVSLLIIKSVSSRAFFCIVGLRLRKNILRLQCHTTSLTSFLCTIGSEIRGPTV